MKSRKLVLSMMLLAITTIISPVSGQETLTIKEPQLSFFDRLRAEEEKEQDAHDQMIMNASDEEFRIILAQRMTDAFIEADETQTLNVVMDVTDEVNKPEPGFLERFFTSEPDPNQIAILKIQSMLGGATSQSSKSLGDTVSPVYFDLKVVRKSPYPEDSRQFQTVQGSFNKAACDLLLSNSNVTDVYATRSSAFETGFMNTFFRKKGRVLPKLKRRKYDEAFIQKGLYDELMQRFETQETVSVDISLKEIEPLKPVVNPRDFLKEWSADYEFIVLYDQGSSYASIVANKKLVEAMKQDERVRKIRITPNTNTGR